MALEEFKIATLAARVAGLANLEDLATPITPPRWFFQPYTETIRLGSGLTRGIGFPVAEWRWDVISAAQRDMLRTYCTGASIEVYIRTRKNDSSSAYANYKAVMIWPAEFEEVDATRRLDFVIRFERLEVQV